MWPPDFELPDQSGVPRLARSGFRFGKHAVRRCPPCDRADTVVGVRYATRAALPLRGPSGEG
jgi:hypothetical protein